MEKNQNTERFHSFPFSCFYVPHWHTRVDIEIYKNLSAACLTLSPTLERLRGDAFALESRKVEFKSIFDMDASRATI